MKGVRATERGLYAAASGMIVQMIRTDTIANNLANVDTAGFKKDLSIFQSGRANGIYRIGGEPIPPLPVALQVEQGAIGSLANGAEFVRNYTDFAQGSLQRTDKPLDLAITGPDYFTVQTPAGTLYTRDGAFNLDANGVLRTAVGYPVLNVNGRQIVLGRGNIAIDQTGQIFLDGQLVDQIRRVTLPNTLSIQKLSDNLYRYTGTTGPAKGEVQQGFLERSNANAIREIVNLIEAQRAYESSSKALTSEDNALNLAVTQVGTTR